MSKSERSPLIPNARTRHQGGDEEAPLSEAGSTVSSRQAPSDASGTTISRKSTDGSSSKSVRTMIYCVILLCAGVGNSIFFKKMTNHMPNYPYFISLATTVVYVPFFAIICAYYYLYTNAITDEMLEIKKIKFFSLGAFDSLAGLLMLFGAVHTSGSNQALLANAVIPITMVLAYVFLSTRFKMTQIAGAFTIILGVAVVLMPNFLAGGAAGSSDQPIFNIIFLCSVVPAAVSAIYKEFLFSKVDIDINYLQAWVSVWQCIFSLLMIPLNTLSILGPNSMSWGELPYTLLNGVKCLFGHNSITLPDCWVPPHAVEGYKQCDSCQGSWMYVLLYLFFNVNYNIFTVLVIKYGGASLLYIVLTLRLPLVQLAFSMPFINYPPDPFQWPAVVGLVMILVGLIAYRWSALKPASDDEEVIVGFVGENQLPITISRPVMAHLRGRTARQIKHAYMTKLGVLESPRTPHSRHSRPSSRGSNHSHTRTFSRQSSVRGSSPRATSYGTYDQRSVDSGGGGWRGRSGRKVRTGSMTDELEGLDEYGAPLRPSSQRHGRGRGRGRGRDKHNRRLST